MTFYRNKRVTTCLALLVAFAPGLCAQSPSPPKRPFDAFSGLLVSCQTESDVKWGNEACTYLIAEVQRRATESKVKVSVQPSSPDISEKKFGDTDGFNGDKAIRMTLAFTASSEVKGRVNFSLASNVIWEPTAREIPGVVPGQRLVQNFYIQGSIFEPEMQFKEVKSTLAKMLDWFFEYGNGK
jgi:hypothetical protein